VEKSEVKKDNNIESQPKIAALTIPRSTGTIGTNGKRIRQDKVD
jgi:hypothetical protein